MKQLGMGKNDVNERGFLIRNHGGQKEMVKHFQALEEKKLLIQNSLPSEK